MTVKDYALDVNLSVAEVLKKCNDLNINVKNASDELSDDDIIMLDNTINLISSDTEITYDEADTIDEAVDEIMTSNSVNKEMKSGVKREKLKKKDTLNTHHNNEYDQMKKQMYKHKNKLMKNEVDENIVIYKDGMTVNDLAVALNVKPIDLVGKLMGLGAMLNVNQSDLEGIVEIGRDVEGVEVSVFLYEKDIKIFKMGILKLK